MTLMDLLEQCHSLDVDKRLAFCFKCKTESEIVDMDMDRRYYVLDAGLDSDDNRVELKYSTDLLYQFKDFFETYKLFEISNTIPTTDIDHIAAENALRSEENKIQPEKLLLVYFKDIDFVAFEKLIDLVLYEIAFNRIKEQASRLNDEIDHIKDDYLNAIEKAEIRRGLLINDEKHVLNKMKEIKENMIEKTK